MILQAQRAVIPSLLPPYRTEEELKFAKYSGWKPVTDVCEVHRRFVLKSKLVQESDRFQLPDDFAPQLSIWLFHEQQGKPDLPVIRNWLWRDSFNFDMQRHRSLKAVLNVELNHVVLAVRGEMTKAEDIKYFLTLLHVCADRVRRFLNQYVSTAFEVDERAVCYKCLCHETHYTKPCDWPVTVNESTSTVRQFGVVTTDDGKICPPFPLYCQRRPKEVVDPDVLLGEYALDMSDESVATALKATRDISLR